MPRRRVEIVKNEEANPFFPHQFCTRIKFQMRPRILITQQAYNDMFVLVDEVDNEVGWMGLVEKEGEEIFIIKEIFLLKQEVDATTTILDRQALMGLTSELLKRKDGLEVVNQLKFWGHSHVEMDTFPSGKDEDQLEAFKKNRNEFFIRGIANKRGKIQFSLFLFDKGIEIVDVPWSLLMEADDSSRGKWKTELKQKVKEKKFVYAASKHSWPAYAADPVVPRGGHLLSDPLDELDSSSVYSNGRFGNEEGTRVYSRDRLNDGD